MVQLVGCCGIQKYKTSVTWTIGQYKRMAAADRIWWSTMEIGCWRGRILLKPFGWLSKEKHFQPPRQDINGQIKSQKLFNSNPDANVHTIKFMFQNFLSGSDLEYANCIMRYRILDPY